jgi:hypothetical protein
MDSRNLSILAEAPSGEQLSSLLPGRLRSSTAQVRRLDEEQTTFRHALVCALRSHDAASRRNSLSRRRRSLPMIAGGESYELSAAPVAALVV